MKYKIWFILSVLCFFNIREVRAEQFSIKVGNNTITYSTLSNGNEVVIQSGNKFVGALNIPARIIYNNIIYNVVSIGMAAFTNSPNLTKVTLPNTIQVIGTSAFSKCTGLTSVTIPASVTSIGSFCFNGCSKLASIKVCQPVPLNIDNSTFENCPISTLYVPKGSKAIYKANTYWGKITNGIVEYNETSPLNYSYSGSTASVIESTTQYTGEITIPSKVLQNGKVYNVTGIENEAFKDCASVTSISIPVSVIKIGSSAFDGCTGLTYLSLPDKLTILGHSAFNNCTGIISLSIPDGVQSIPWFAFTGCTKLKSVYIPKSITDISLNAFNKCPVLIDINIDKENLAYTDIGGVLYNKNVSELLACPGGISLVQLGKTVQEVKKGALNYGVIESIEVDPLNPFLCSQNGILYNKDMTKMLICPNASVSVIIPQTVKRIDDFAFSYCNKLSVIDIPSEVSSIGEYAFLNCDNISTIRVNSFIPCVVEESTFYGIYQKTILYVPKGASINYHSDKNWGKFDSIQEYDVNTEIYYKYHGTTASVIADPNGSKYKGDITIPETVTYQNVTYKVTNIEFAFQGCDELTSITLPQSIETIGIGAFWGASKLSSITVPKNVKKIGNYAFASTNIASIFIPEAVTEIGVNAFGKCMQLTSIEVATTNTAYISIDGALYSKDLSTFIECPAGLTHFQMDNNVKHIEIGAFDGCAYLSSITLSENTEIIGTCAFAGCICLSSIVLPSKLKSMEINIFPDCTGLTSITTYSVTPPQVSEKTFHESLYSNITLYVPQQSFTLYKSNEIWGNFLNITPFNGTNIKNTKSESSIDDIQVLYTDNGIVINSQQKQNITLYDLSGKVVKDIFVVEGENIINDLPKGTYIIKGKLIVYTNY